MSDAFNYSFRFCCDPGFNDAREVAVLEDFAEEARIDDVMVFANVEEINTGHMSFEEQDAYLELIKRVQEVMTPRGITTSVNHWHTLMHADLGKKLRAGQHFRLMTDLHGNRAELSVCPLCEEWRRYIAQLYSRYAALHPEVLWVEDDFRLHNHAPLVWGGCFCEEHMRMYSGLAGKELTREEFVSGLLQPGKVHPYRKIWLDVSRRVMVEIAELIGDAVHSVSDRTRVGLMSSTPQAHAAEGRDWAGVLRGLAGPTLPLNRIHLPGYIEGSPSFYMMNFNAVSMLTRALVPPETEIAPELENFPYSRFTKSRRFTRFQLLASMPLNMKGVTIDLYDLNGNGIVWEENYQQMLCGVKDYLNRLTERSVFAREAVGIRVMCSQDSSYTLFTREGKAMEELYPREMFFGSLLSSFGIPFVYCTDPMPKGQITAVSGQYLRNLGTRQIRYLFENNFVILDGEAAFTLQDLKLGELAGIRHIHWMKQNEGEYAFEQVTNGKSYCGIEQARASAILLCSDAVAVEYGEGARPLTGLFDSYRRLRAPGCTLVEENVLVLPFGGFDSYPEMPRMLLNNIRQAVMQDVVANAGERFRSFPFVVGEPYLIPYCYRVEGGLALYLVNAATDRLDRVRLHWGTLEVHRVSAFGSRDCVERTVEFIRAGDMLELELAVESLETVLVTLFTGEML